MFLLDGTTELFSISDSDTVLEVDYTETWKAKIYDNNSNTEEVCFYLMEKLHSYFQLLADTV
jgi:hypothetical protein